MNIKELSTIISRALRAVHESKATVFTAQRACVAYAREHNNFEGMSRLIRGLHAGKVYNGKALLVFVLETCGATNGKGGALGWREKDKTLFLRQDATVTEAMLARLETLPFWEYRKPQALAFATVDVIRQAVARTEKAKDEGTLKDWTPDVDKAVAEIKAVLAKYGMDMSKTDAKAAAAQ